MRRRDLQRALRALGSVQGLGRRLGISPSTLRRWLAKGVPKDPEKRARVTRVLENVRTVKERSKGQRQTFAELLKLAGEVKALPKMKTREGLRSGRLTRGYQYTKSIDRNLDSEGDLLDEIGAWAVGRAKRHPIFQLVATVSLYALSDEVDLNRRDSTGHNYPSIFKKLPHDDSDNFVVDTKVSSIAATNRNEVLADFDDKMWGVMQGGMVLVHVHGVTLFNYRRRTKEETRLFETGKARERKKKKKTRKPKQKKTRKQAKKKKKKIRIASRRRGGPAVGGSRKKQKQTRKKRQ